MIIEEIAKHTLEEIKKANKKPYPLYYKEVFNNLLKENNLEINPKLILENQTISDKFLNQTSNTVEFIQSTNQDIEAHSKDLIQEIEIKDLIEKLNHSTQKINELQKELNKLYEETNIDTLTKAYSKKALNQDLEKLINVGKKRELNMAIIVIDLDHFKNINDNYGHLIGDFILIKVVQIIQNIIREEDRIYRFGGDEFVVIFHRIDKNSIKKIRQKIESTKLKYKDQIIQLTLSIGVTCHKKGDSKDDFLHRADQAVYKSKITRNKVSIIC